MNFEGIISGDVYGSETKAAPPQLLQSLASAGVDILQTANSCSVYDGLQSLKSTLQGVKAAGMTPVGTFADKEEFEKSGGYLLWEINGIKVAFVAFTKGMNGSGLPVSGEGCVNLLYKDYTSNQEDYSTIYQKVDKDGITKVLRNAAAQNPDVTIALLHWGSDSVDQISKTQTQICKLMQEEGVDAIIGTHSHFLQKMEYDPENGTFVAYSLGDFLGDFRQATDHSGTNYSVLLNLEITKSGTTGETKITGYDCVPIYREERDGKLRILRIREAMEGYESNFLGRVSEETYNAMKSAMTQISKRTGLENE
jgi:poly-gamma-glutamate synthesis protein (capsule biosynthesis protein)